MIMDNWMFILTAITFTGFGYYVGHTTALYYDVKLITQNVIDQLEEKGFINKIINEEGDEELVPHPEARKTQ